MAGIYIHIPFCKQQCTYCDFHFSTTFDVYRERMIQALLNELKLRANDMPGKVIETIYFGGGTPSLLTKSELSAFLDLMKASFVLVDTPEITLEANPDDCTEEQLANWKEVGVNRLSIGLQSFKESDLKWMNRAHSVEEAKTCFTLIQQAGFQNVTVDLMYGLPNLTEDEWREHIQTVLDWNVPHISSYCLTVEKNTVLEKRVRTGELRVADDEMQSRQFEILLEILEKNGVHQYEISNFSKPGFESRHNANYWKGVPYLGVGPSAHSYQGKKRRWNVANNSLYMKGVENESVYWESEKLTTADQFNELLLTGLRTTFGVSLKKLSSYQTLSDMFLSKVSDFKLAGWMEEKNNQLFLSKEGRLRADYIASELFLIDNSMS